jgi:phosphatidylglycerophosphate synthase
VEETKLTWTITIKNKQTLSYIKAYEPWSVVFFVDPLIIPLVPILATLRISPNLITAGVLLTGLSAGLFFALGFWFWGAVIFLFSHFLDCLDGKVARLRGITSEFGAKLDNFADSLRKPSCFLGITVYFYRNDSMLFALLTVVVFVAHVAVHKSYGFLGVSHCDLEFPDFHRKVIRRFAPRVLALYTYFEEFFFLFVVCPLLVYFADIPRGGVLFLWGGLIITTLTFLKLLILWNHRRKGRYQQVYQDWVGTKGNLEQQGL